MTHQGLRELVEHEAQETFRFLTREVNLDDLAARPWHERWPKSALRFFLAVAYRLSPWRRVLFALAVLVLAGGWCLLLLGALQQGPLSLRPMGSPLAWLALAGTVLFFLLALELRDKLGLKGDLEVARQIQFGLLPFEPVEREGVAIATAMRPANTVGGDYFDLIELGERRLAFAVGDVAGKGMPAALLMALLQGSLRTLLSAGFRGSELASKLNAHLCANIPSNRLITFFYGELDIASGRIDYVNCGHNPPLLFAHGHPPARLAATAMALGVTEAESPKDEEFGEARLCGWLQANREDRGQRLVDGVITEVLHHCGTARPRDDMTLMCIDSLR